MSRLLPPLLLGIAVFAALSVARWLLRPEPPALPEPVTLALPELLGCWELDAGEWVFGATSDSSGASANSGPDSASLALLAIPDRVLLLPDSIDEWERPYTTYRASPVAGEPRGSKSAWPTISLSPSTRTSCRTLSYGSADRRPASMISNTARRPATFP